MTILGEVMGVPPPPPMPTSRPHPMDYQATTYSPGPGSGNSAAPSYEPTYDPRQHQQAAEEQQPYDATYMHAQQHAPSWQIPTGTAVASKSSRPAAFQPRLHHPAKQQYQHHPWTGNDGADGESVHDGDMESEDPSMSSIAPTPHADETGGGRPASAYGKLASGDENIFAPLPAVEDDPFARTAYLVKDNLQRTAYLLRAAHKYRATLQSTATAAKQFATALRDTAGGIDRLSPQMGEGIGKAARIHDLISERHLNMKDCLLGAFDAPLKSAHATHVKAVSAAEKRHGKELKTARDRLKHAQSSGIKSSKKRNGDKFQEVCVVYFSKGS